MKKAVTFQGKTVEQAIEQALENLNATRDEIEVEILSDPGKRLLRFRKGLAEIKVTIKEHTKESDNKNEIDSEEIGASVLENGKFTDEKPTVKSGVRVKNGQLEFSFDGELRPSITPGKDVMLYVNDELITEKVLISEDDSVTMSISDELIPPKFSIDFVESNLVAVLKFTPGEKVEKTLRDVPITMNLALTPEEKVSYYNGLQPQNIVDELKRMGVQQGIIFPAIQEVVQAEKPCETIVARGVPPEEGKDGELELHIESDKFNPDSLDKIDFREMNIVSTVKESDSIATHVPPIEGKDGCDLLGKVILAKQVQNVILRLGRNVELIDGVVVAKVNGNPLIEWRSKTVSIDVNPEFYHPGDVSLESGNIRSEGDVRIGGDVRTSMFVMASGTVRVGGAVRKARIEAMHSAYISGNVLSSDITVGKRDNVQQELVEKLKEMVVGVMQIENAIEQIAATRGSEGYLSSAELKQLIHLLMEKRHVRFIETANDFVYAVNESRSELSDDWGIIGDELYLIFLTPVTEELPEGTNLKYFIEKLEDLIELYEVDTSITRELIVPYIANSRLFSSGNIEVNEKGSIQSVLVAGNDICIRGVCRGGEVIARNNIVLQESGSENSVTTIVKTGEKGSIKIGKVYIGTEIQVGNRKHVFERDDYEIFARIDTYGRLILR